ncbi:MAG: crossover junction endodeoxyribonuclease RuvC, partial [Patescibacteria group bacterium]
VLIQETQPAQAVVEEVYFGKNAKTAGITAHARGVLLYILRRHLIPVEHITPSQVKSRLTGYGSADKHQVQRLIAQRLHLTSVPEPDDAADALAAALSTTVPAHPTL